MLDLSKLHPANILSAIESDDMSMVWLQQVGKLRLRFCFDPVHPDACKRFDRFNVEVESKSVVS
jgi:hypothetical protein